MPTLIYEGRIEPEAYALTIDYKPKLRRQETEHSPVVEFEVVVFVGRVRVYATSDDIDDKLAEELIFAAWDVSRIFVETVGFIEGIPYSVSLDRVIFPDKKIKSFVFADRSLANEHDFSISDIEALSDFSLLSLPDGLLFSDILMTLGKAHYSPIACGRVADSLARLIAPGAKRERQWEMLRETLRVDETFVRSLTDVSKALRHGDRVPVDASTNQETAHRAWALLGRYLRYKLNGKLDSQAYPMLTG